MPNLARVTSDHREIRRWAERHGGRPAVQKRLGSPNKLPRIGIFFDRTDEAAKHETTWDNFLDVMEESNLSLIYEDDSNWFKFVNRRDLDIARRPELRRPNTAKGRRAQRIASRLGMDGRRIKKADSKGTKKVVRVSTQQRPSKRKIRPAA
jgi:hypothetical protein